LQTPSIKSLLSRLITLTGQRESNSLELSLAKTLFDLAAPSAIVIYRTLNIEQHLFSATLIDGAPFQQIIPKPLLQALEKCIKSGNVCQYAEQDKALVMLYPLKSSKNEPVAVVAIESREHESEFREVTGMLLQIYQNFMELMSDNERDTLTGLLNRKTFERKIGKVITRIQHLSNREGDHEEHKQFFAIFDIDHFKQVNDQYGHLVGDEVLLRFSQLMTQSLRDKDMLFRFGGEEFVGVFECHNLDEMHTVLDRFRTKIEVFPFPQVGRVTISSGFTEISGFDVSSQIIDRADVALYYAKNHGRNQVCNYEALVAVGLLQENKLEGDIELF